MTHAMLQQVLSVADAAAHGIAAAVMMSISAGIRRRCQAVAASRRSGQIPPPCAPDAQLAAALPAISILVDAQVSSSAPVLGRKPLLSLTPNSVSHSVCRPSPGHSSSVHAARRWSSCRVHPARLAAASVHTQLLAGALRLGNRATRRRLASSACNGDAGGPPGRRAGRRRQGSSRKQLNGSAQQRSGSRQQSSASCGAGGGRWRDGRCHPSGTDRQWGRGLPD